MKPPVYPAPWEGLKALTPARIATGRSGISLPTAEHLRFQLDHARARRAVHYPLPLPALLRGTQDRGLPVVQLRSAAADRATYLQRPDLGRRLCPDSREVLLRARETQRAAGTRTDLALVVADGLSALAVERNLPDFLDALLPAASARGLSCAPVIFVEQGRVAIGDEIGEALEADQVAVLIGERPGLSAADSLGIYFTHAPRRGLTDEARNCISNIRPGGLSPAAAAGQLLWLADQARRTGLSGVALKDDSGGPPGLPGH